MNKLLIVVDMQNDFVNGTLGTKEAESIVDPVLEKIRNFDGTVVYTRDTHQKDYLQTQEGKNLPIEHCIQGTKGWELQEEIQALQKEKGGRVFDKVTFGSKDLVAYLQEENQKEAIDEIILVGLCTDVCVISNALAIKTFLPEVPVSVDERCCAGVTPQNHQTAIEAMRACQINCY